jgi:hypothetical protein
MNINFIYKLNSYLTENTVRVRYREKSVNSVGKMNGIHA